MSSESGEISLYFSINPPIDAERHGAIPPLVNIPTLGMMCERAGMLKIIVYFFESSLYILIPMKSLVKMNVWRKISPIVHIHSSIIGNLDCFEHRIYINYLTGHKLQHSSVHG